MKTAAVFSGYLTPEKGIIAMDGMDPNDSVETFAVNTSFDDTLYVGSPAVYGKTGIISCNRGFRNRNNKVLQQRNCLPGAGQYQWKGLHQLGQ